MKTLPVDVEGLIPHGHSMRFIDQLTHVTSEEARTTFRVPAASPFIDGSGMLDETAYIEMIAQSAAASHGFQLSTEERENHTGMLLGVQRMTISHHAKSGDDLAITVRTVAQLDDIAIVEGEVHRKNGEIIAAGELKLWTGKPTS